jgi:ribokinase
MTSDRKRKELLMEVTVVGSINIDIVALTERYPNRGETIFGKNIEILPGGKGANQAITCSKLGKKVVLIGCVGMDVFGDRLIETLDRNGVKTYKIKRTQQVSTGVALITIDETAENTMLVIKGANDLLGLEDIDNCMDEIRSSKVLLVQMEVPEKTVIHAMTIAKENGVSVVLDPAPAEGISLRALEFADIITPNRQETKHLTGIDATDVHSALSAARYFESIGVKHSIIKMAEKGCLVYSQGNWQHIEPVSVSPIDTVGAGDSFAGALACAIADGVDMFTAARFASIVAALKVTKWGAQEGIPTLREVNEFCRERNLTYYLIEKT